MIHGDWELQEKVRRERRRLSRYLVGIENAAQVLKKQTFGLASRNAGGQLLSYQILAVALQDFTQTCDAVRYCIGNQNDAGAHILIRHQIELSSRCLWAAVHEDGWARMMSHQVQTSMQSPFKWAKVSPNPDIGHSPFDRDTLSSLLKANPMPDSLDKVHKQMIAEYNKKSKRPWPIKHERLTAAAGVFTNPLAHGNLLILSTSQQPNAYSVKHSVLLQWACLTHYGLAVVHTYGLREEQVMAPIVATRPDIDTPATNR